MRHETLLECMRRSDVPMCGWPGVAGLSGLRWANVPDRIYGYIFESAQTSLKCERDRWAPRATAHLTTKTANSDTVALMTLRREGNLARTRHHRTQARSAADNLPPCARDPSSPHPRPHTSNCTDGGAVSMLQATSSPSHVHVRSGQQSRARPRASRPLPQRPTSASR